VRRPLLLPLIAGIAVLSATLVGFGQVSPGPPGSKPPSTAPAREASPPTGKPTNQPNGPTVPPGQGTSVPGGAPADDKTPPEKVVPLVSYPDDPKLAIAQRLLSSGHFEYAKNLITQVLDARPEVGRAEFFLGVALTKMKKYEDARPHLERSLQLRQPFPEAKHAHHFMGWASYHLGELGRARSDFEAHLAEVPDEPDSIFALGLIAFDEDRLDDAEKHFQKAIELQQDPKASRRDLAKAWIRLGDLSMRRDDPAKAEERYMTGLSYFADHYEGWAKLARSRERLGKVKEAESARNEEQRARERVGVKDIEAPLPVPPAPPTNTDAPPAPSSIPATLPTDAGKPASPSK
jgi:Flp pilus assembly protein TadD